MSDDKPKGAREALGDVKNELKLQATILFGCVALLWAIEIIDFVIFQQGLDGLGIRPRSISGLWGVLFAPFLHGGFGHLAANTAPFIALGWFVMLRETHHLIWVTLIGMVVAGLGVWLIGASNSVHIGASSVVFAYLGYLLLRGWFERRVLPIAGSIAVGLLYGGLLFGLFPGQPGISWEGHLFGFIGGVVAAKVMTKRADQSPKKAAG